MACATCDHTMQKVNDGRPPVFWCPRCGTLKSEGCHPEFQSPSVVQRAERLFGVLLNSDVPDFVEVRMRDVKECIGLPRG